MRTVISVICISIITIYKSNLLLFTVGINLIIQHIQDVLKNTEIAEANGNLPNVIQNGNGTVRAIQNGHGTEASGGIRNGIFIQNENFHAPRSRHRSGRSTPH